jgi:hypothetical protein
MYSFKLMLFLFMNIIKHRADQQVCSVHTFPYFFKCADLGLHRQYNFLDRTGRGWYTSIIVYKPHNNIWKESKHEADKENPGTAALHRHVSVAVPGLCLRGGGGTRGSRDG